MDDLTQNVDVELNENVDQRDNQRYISKGFSLDIASLPLPKELSQENLD